MQAAAGISGAPRSPESVRSPQGATKRQSKVAEIAGFAACDVFADAAGDHDAVERPDVVWNVSQEQRGHCIRQGTLSDCRLQNVGQVYGNILKIGGREGRADSHLDAGLSGMVDACCLGPDYLLVLDRDQTPADVQGGGP